MNASELLDELSIRVFEPPLASFRDDERISDRSNPLTVVMLLIEYETECSMNGIIGYLGNSSCRRLPETIDAIRTVGCTDHATILERIQNVAITGGMTCEATQRELAELEPFAVTSLDELHGDKWDDICGRDQTLHEEVDWEEFWRATTDFVSKYMDAIQSNIRSYCDGSHDETPESLGDVEPT